MEFEFIDKALYFPMEKILVMSDFHIGYEESFNKQGILVPRHQFKETMKDLEEIFKEIKEREININEIVLLGDVKHEFGEISQQEWSETFKLLDYLFSKGKKIIVTKGNHDTILEPILKKFPKIKFVDYYLKEGILFMHGDKIEEQLKSIDLNGVKMIVRGHWHPAISLKKGVKKEKYKCFLEGKYKDKKIIVVPCFLTVVEGTDVSEREGFEDFKVHAIGDKIYDFGKVKDID